MPAEGQQTGLGRGSPTKLMRMGLGPRRSFQTGDKVGLKPSALHCYAMIPKYEFCNIFPIFRVMTRQTSKKFCYRSVIAGTSLLPKNNCYLLSLFTTFLIFSFVSYLVFLFQSLVQLQNYFDFLILDLIANTSLRVGDYGTMFRRPTS